jgi:Ribbon-helix-helix protein, copG family
MKSISDIPKKRGPGRPATGRDPMLTFRSPAELTAALDEAAKAEGLSRGKVIRRAVAEWLRAKGFLQ